MPVFTVASFQGDHVPKELRHLVACKWFTEIKKVEKVSDAIERVKDEENFATDVEFFVDDRLVGRDEFENSLRDSQA